MDHFCYLCFVSVLFSCLFIPALLLPAGKWLTSLLLHIMFYCVLVTFPCSVLGQMWCLIVSISDILGQKRNAAYKTYIVYGGLSSISRKRFVTV